MADWNHYNVYDAEQGKVVASASPIITEKCGFSFKPPKTNVHAFPCICHALISVMNVEKRFSKIIKESISTRCSTQLLHGQLPAKK